MKTNLNIAITTVEEAKLFLTALFMNGEAFNPDDNASNIDVWQSATRDEQMDVDDQLFKCCNFTGFDAHQYLLDLEALELLYKSANKNNVSVQEVLDKLLNPPTPEQVQNTALPDEYTTLLDKFAMAALTGILANPSMTGDDSAITVQWTASVSYKFAEEMLEARKKYIN